MAKVGMPNYGDINTDYIDAQLPTLYYNFEAYKQGVVNEESKGQLMFDCHDISGAGGWFMTPIQYGSFIDGLFGGELVSDDDLQEMKDDQLGMWQYPGEHGTYYTHNGGGEWGGTDKGGQCIWMYYPEANLSLFVAWNSVNNDLTNTNEIMADIFENAYDQ